MANSLLLPSLTSLLNLYKWLFVDFVQLALRPTPIHRWNLPGVPSGYEVWVKRDDMAGSVLGGNKIRKLEFFLADALERGCDSVITSGNLQSNQCRVTALAARQLGLQPHLLLRHKGEMVCWQYSYYLCNFEINIKNRS